MILWTLLFVAIIPVGVLIVAFVHTLTSDWGQVRRLVHERAALEQRIADAFPLRYRSPYISGYQPLREPAERNPPQGGSVIAPPSGYASQGQSNVAQLALMKAVECDIEHDQAGLTAQQAADALTMAFAHGRPSIYDFIPGYQPKDEPLPQEQYPVAQMECEVRYERV